MFIHMGVPKNHERINIDAEALADCAVEMGARYLLVVAKHNNGYLWWLSKTRARAGIQHNQHNQGPNQRDILGELAAAARKRGLKFGV